MAYYEVTLKGFDASSDETDHLVKWVRAHNERAVRDYLGDDVQSVVKMDFAPPEQYLDHDLTTTD